MVKNFYSYLLTSCINYISKLLYFYLQIKSLATELSASGSPVTGDVIYGYDFPKAESAGKRTCRLD